MKETASASTLTPPGEESLQNMVDGATDVAGSVSIEVNIVSGARGSFVSILQQEKQPSIP